ncbi:MAG: DUF87 domain-containing protein [Deltaproteobacteria bacterium]|nr:DUF87 domain-containing protein [Deltaproteobacteria bacterium]
MGVDDDGRLKAFTSLDGDDVFHSVEHWQEIYREDPFDVETLFAPAREVFQRLMTRATTPPGLPSGRLLLVLGESGAGKTHLARAFRNYVHDNRLGFVGYMQMTSQVSNYGRYVLSKLVDSLDQPYREGLSSGVVRLSKALAGRVGGPELARVRDAETLEQRELDELVGAAADRVLELPGCDKLDLNLLRAILYLQRDDAKLHRRVLDYLRCQELTETDRRWLGGMPARAADEDPLRTAQALGRLLWQVGQQSLVLCVDQLEDSFNFDEANQRFPRAINTLVALADQVPSSVIVIFCLEQYYTEVKRRLTQSMLDRLEKDPDTLRLPGLRSLDEVRELVGRRVHHLMERAGVEVDPAEPCYPIPEERLARWAQQRTRDVLSSCSRYQNEAIRLGRLPDSSWEPDGSRPTEAALPAAAPEAPVELQRLWNDFKTEFRGERPDSDDEAGLAAIVGWAVEACGAELESGHSFKARVQGSELEVDVVDGSGAVTEALLARVCNKAAQGVGLANQVDALAKAAVKARRKPVIVRSVDYPKSAGSKVAKKIGELVAGDGKRLSLLDSELRTVLALRAFEAQHKATPGFHAWRAADNPLTQLALFDELLGLQRLAMLRVAPAPAAVASPAPAPPPAARPAPAAPAPAAPGLPEARPREFVLGMTTGARPLAFSLPAGEFTKHSAFLGSTGSGKTTLALAVIEQALMAGIPTVMIDRKGDLASYAAAATWSLPEADPERSARRAALRAGIDIALYTPGAVEGRPVGISLLPPGTEHLSTTDREDEVAWATEAVAGMLGYKDVGGGRDRHCRAILQQALLLLAELPGGAGRGLEGLIQLLGEHDPELVGRVGKLDAKLFTRIAQDLDAHRLSTARLFDPASERLHIDDLLARQPGGRPRLSIVSTKFLGDNARVVFWLAQLLARITRWANQNPSSTLQALLLLDEADLYLPATTRPATKPVIENLLKRARSNGIGIMLATQSPGDLDYKCRDNLTSWFVGRVTQTTALAKMKPLLQDSPLDMDTALAKRKTGEFYLLRGGPPVDLRARRSAIDAHQLSEPEILAAAAATRG